ncbi:hypothetical protein EJD96_11670 [Herbaspirillum seropedicae]|uniref:hypothetical protein n=1 Tax=Herbaspirillum seropedicae TaxID=964 RepID=UPI0011233E8F|nr:hypothetical protein [Herbaspirillum seropedicae]QDD64776.1 hypothetical protein EJD96_11670 [Herbaspirillum seropedicae]
MKKPTQQQPDKINSQYNGETKKSNQLSEISLTTVENNRPDSLKQQQLQKIIIKSPRAQQHQAAQRLIRKHVPASLPYRDNAILQGRFYNQNPNNLVDEIVFKRLENLALNYWYPDDIAGLEWVTSAQKIAKNTEQLEDFVPWLEKTLTKSDLQALLESYQEKFGHDLKTEGLVAVTKDEDGESSPFLMELKSKHPDAYVILSSSQSAYRHIVEAAKKGIILGKNPTYQKRADEANRALTHTNEIYIPSSETAPAKVADSVIFEIFNALASEERGKLSLSTQNPGQIADHVINMEIKFYAEKLELLKDIPELRIQNLEKIEKWEKSNKLEWFAMMVKSHGETMVEYKGKKMTIRESYISMASEK